MNQNKPIPTFYFTDTPSIIFCDSRDNTAARFRAYRASNNFRIMRTPAAHTYIATLDYPGAPVAVICTRPKQ